ncbi:MAG: hypothetical protein ACLFU2_08820, partial [Opitutales bacterium]
MRRHVTPDRATLQGGVARYFSSVFGAETRASQSWLKLRQEARELFLRANRERFHGELYEDGSLCGAVC